MLEGKAKMNFKERIAGMNQHYRYYHLETFFARLQEAGIHYAQLWCGPMHFYIDHTRHDDVQILKELEAKYNVSIIGICPEQTNPKPYNIASKDRIEDVFAYYQQIIEVASLLGCNQVLVTSGWAYLDEDKEEAWLRSITMMRRIVNLAKQHAICLVMEALQPDESILVNTVQDLKRYFDEVQHDALQVCIDFGAMARAQDTIQDYFESFPNQIALIHFVDGNPTGHLAWGDGDRNLKGDLKQLEKYQYKGFLSLETASSRYFQEPWMGEKTTLTTWKKIEGECLCDIIL